MWFEESGTVDEVEARMVAGMLGYMTPAADDPDFRCPYGREEIDRCVAIVDGYLAALAATPPPDEKGIRRAIETAVLALNDLNERCDHELIETVQREQLATILMLAASHAGLRTEEDLTEEWREW